MYLESILEVLRTWPSTLNIHFFIGGFTDPSEDYARQCIQIATAVKERHPGRLYYDPYSSLTKEEVIEINVFSDFGVVPSLFEPGGLTQLEFLAASTPVICSSTGGLKDTVVDLRLDPGSGNGLLCEAGDAESLKEAILYAS